LGTAELTISFEAWVEGAVAPSKHKVEIVRPKVNFKLEPVSPRLIQSLVHPDRRSYISLLRYSGDGRRMAVAGYPSGVIQIWDAVGGKELTRIETPPGLRGTGDYVALTADWTMAFVPLDGRKVVHSEINGEMRITIEYDGEVQVWDLATRKTRAPIKLGPGCGVSGATVSPDGTKLITIEARSYDSEGAKFVPHAAVYRDLSGRGPPVELAVTFAMAAFAPDSRAFVLATSAREKGPGLLRLFDALTGKQTALLSEEPQAKIYYPTFSADGKRVAAEVREFGEKASVVKLWDIATGKEVAVLKPAERSPVLNPTFSPDGKFVTAHFFKGGGQVWDARTGELILAPGFDEKRHTVNVMVSPDGRLVAAVGTPRFDPEVVGHNPDPADLPQPHVDLYDLSTGKLVETLVCPAGHASRMAFSPDGTTLAFGGSGAVHLFDIGDLTKGKRR
jgi:WD40 repeat protein